MRCLRNDVKIKLYVKYFLIIGTFQVCLTARGDFLLGNYMMQLIILAVITEDKSIRFEGKNGRLSFGTVSADLKKKKRHLDLANGELKITGRGGVFNDTILFVFFSFIL